MVAETMINNDKNLSKDSVRRKGITKRIRLFFFMHACIGIHDIRKGDTIKPMRVEVHACKVPRDEEEGEEPEDD